MQSQAAQLDSSGKIFGSVAAFLTMADSVVLVGLSMVRYPVNDASLPIFSSGLANLYSSCVWQLCKTS